MAGPATRGRSVVTASGQRLQAAVKARLTPITAVRPSRRRELDGSYRLTTGYFCRTRTRRRSFNTHFLWGDAWRTGASVWMDEQALFVMATARRPAAKR